MPGPPAARGARAAPLTARGGDPVRVHPDWPAAPSDPAQALAMVRAGLGYLSACDAASLGTAGLAGALVGLEQAEAQHTAARARMLAAFTAQQGHHADGQYGPASWLRAVTRVTNGAAAGAVRWARRLAAHPLIAAALAAGQLSSSWARALCAWTDQLPDDRRADADAILLAAAHGGAALADLAALAEQMIERSRTTPDTDRDKGTFDDRAVWLETTIGGAGRLTGDLTGPAAAAVTAVLDALSGRGGAEDTRTLVQRQHDALAEACQRLIESGMLPGDGSSQPVQVTVHVDLAELRGQPGASGLERGWTTARAAAAGLPGSVYLTGPDAEAAACDAALTPVVTGHLDRAALDQLTERGPGHHQPPHRPLQRHRRSRPRTHRPHPRRLQHTLLAWSIDLLSGPAGFPAYLRRHLLPARFPACPSRWTSAAPPGSSPPSCVKPSSSGTKNAASPAANNPPRPARSTTSSPGPKAAPTALGNLALFCRSTTSFIHAGAGTSPATPTAPPPPPHPTDAPSTPTDHPPPPRKRAPREAKPTTPPATQPSQVARRGGEGVHPLCWNRRWPRRVSFGFMPATVRHNWALCETLDY